MKNVMSEHFTPDNLMQSNSIRFIDEKLFGKVVIDMLIDDDDDYQRSSGDCSKGVGSSSRGGIISNTKTANTTTTNDTTKATASTPTGGISDYEDPSKLRQTHHQAEAYAMNHFLQYVLGSFCHIISPEINYHATPFDPESPEGSWEYCQAIYECILDENPVLKSLL